MTGRKGRMGGAAQPPPAQLHPVGSTQHQNRQLSCCIHPALLFKQMYKMWLDARMGGGQTEPKVSCKQRGSDCTPKHRVKYRVKRQSNGERRAEPTSPPYQSLPIRTQFCTGIHTITGPQREGNMHSIH